MAEISSDIQNLGGDSTVPVAKLGTGTCDATKYLRGDQTWAVPTASAATFNPDLYVSTADATIPANSSVVIPDLYEVGSGFMLDIATDGILYLIV